MIHLESQIAMSLTDLTLLFAKLSLFLAESLTSQVCDFVAAILLRTFVTNIDDFGLLVLHLTYYYHILI